MIKLRYFFFAALNLGFALLLSGCNLAILNPKGLVAAQEKHILVISAALMLIVVVPVIFLTFFFAWRYRESNPKSSYAPKWAHSTLIEIICWSVPCIIVGILGVITWKTSHELDPYKPLISRNHPITIQAIALDWKWLFIYPEQHIAAVNFIQFPIGVPVQFLITAIGAMNSFQIPQLGGQIYAMAGMQTKLHLIADELGDYRGISSNFSGNGFSEMKFVARVSTQKAFNQWVREVKQSPNKLNQRAYNELAQPSENNPRQYYSSANPDIYQSLLMKSMMPMDKAVPHLVWEK